METSSYEAEDAIAEIAAVTAFVLVAGFALWPPRNVYWAGVADIIGDETALAVVAALAVGLGAWFGRTSSIGLRHLFVGGVLAYLAGMAAIEVVIAPTSPVHLLWYGLLLAALLVGSLGWRALERVRRTQVSRQ